MNHYEQVPFYSHTEDPVLSAKIIAKKMKTYLESHVYLSLDNSTGNKIFFFIEDWCAGCGVFGLELASELISLMKDQSKNIFFIFSFLEKQEQFIPVLYRNISSFLNQLKISRDISEDHIRALIRCVDLKNYSQNNKYDHRELYQMIQQNLKKNQEALLFHSVVCNPPYYIEGNGKKSSEVIKDRCQRTSTAFWPSFFDSWTYGQGKLALNMKQKFSRVVLVQQTLSFCFPHAIKKNHLLDELLNSFEATISQEVSRKIQLIQDEKNYF